MLTIEGISKDLGEFHLKDVNLTIHEGEYFVVLGPTGAGKTILLETISGIYQPDEGIIYFRGRNITRIPPRLRNIGMVYQDYTLFPHLSVEKNIGFGLRNRGSDKAKGQRRIEELARLLGVHHLLHRRPGTLSGGEQQRVAIARALIMEPEILLLDEPLSALDTATKAKLQEELSRIHSLMGTTMIHVTHSFEEAFILGDRLAIMNDGTIVQYGAPTDVFRKPNTQFTANFLGIGNVFRGDAHQSNGMSHITVEGIEVLSTAPGEGNINLSIRPEEITISREAVLTSARNRFSGPIVSVREEGILTRIVVDIGIPLQIVLTRHAFQEMQLQIGMHIFVMFKATSVHLF
jgi:molybdopterin-binding protein